MYRPVFSSSPFVVWDFDLGNAAVPLHNFVKINNYFLAGFIKAQYFWDLRFDTACSQVCNPKFTAVTYRNTNTQQAFGEVLCIIH